MLTDVVNLRDTCSVYSDMLYEMIAYVTDIINEPAVFDEFCRLARNEFKWGLSNGNQPDG